MLRANGPDCSVGTVSPAYLRTVLDYGESVGIALADQLAAVDLDPTVLDEPASRIAAQPYLALLDWLETVTGDPFVGLHAGAQFKPRHYAEMGYVVLTTPTVRDAILQGIHYEVLANDIARTQLSESAQSARMTWTPQHGPLTRHAHDLHMATWVVFAHWLLGRHHVATLVELPYPAYGDGDTSAHERVFGCPVRFGAGRHAMHMDRALLDLPSMQADAAMQAQMTRIADAQLRLCMPPGADALTQARAYISARLQDGELPIAEVAQHLQVPVRTLQRRLQAQGLSYSVLVDSVRLALAEQYLADPAISLAQLAMRLGFSEQSAFTHAFKRWTQETPNAWRRRHLGAPQR